MPPIGPRSGQTEIINFVSPKSRPAPRWEMSDHESDGDYGNSSAASACSGEIDYEIVDNNSNDEEIDDQSPENACLGDQSDS